MTTPLDPELAVALDVLLERYSPPRPYEYRWSVWRLEGRLMATLSAGEPHVEAWWSLPPLGTDWGAADRLHVSLETAALQRLFDAYEKWWERTTHQQVWRGSDGQFLIVGIGRAGLGLWPDRARGADLDRLAAQFGIARREGFAESDDETDASLRARALAYANLRVEQPRGIVVYGGESDSTE